MANRIRDYPVPVVFKTILLKKSSGKMVIRGKGYGKTLYFIQGKLEYAASDLYQERLAKLLLLKGFINLRQLDQLDAWLESGDADRMGRRLVRSGILTQKQLYDCLIAQVKMIASSAFAIMEGEWEFLRATFDIPGSHAFHIPLPRIIMDGVKEIADFGFYKNLLYRYTLHASKLPEALKQILTPFSLQFFQTLIPLSGQTTAWILDRTVVPEDIFWREVVMFYLLNAVGFRETEEPASDTETIIAIQVGPIKRKSTESEHADTSQTKKSRSAAVTGKPEKTKPPSAQVKSLMPSDSGEIIELLPEAEKKETVAVNRVLSEEPQKKGKTKPPGRAKEYASPFAEEAVIDLPKAEEEQDSISDIFKKTPPPPPPGRDRDSISDIFKVTPAPALKTREKTKPPRADSTTEQDVVIPDESELVSEPASAPVREVESVQPKPDRVLPTEFAVEMGPTLPAGGSEEEATAVHKKGKTKPPSPAGAQSEQEFGIPAEYEIELESSQPADKKKAEYAAPASEEMIEAPRHGRISAQAPAAAATASTLNPKEAYTKALLLYENKKYREAAMLLAPAVRPATSPTSHIFLLGLCQAKVPEYKKEAERHFKSVAEKEPWNADPHYALGELYRSEGLMQKAEASFRLALEINKDHTLAGAAIREIGGQKKKKLPFSGPRGK